MLKTSSILTVVSTKCRLGTDEQTDGGTQGHRYTTLAQRRAVKTEL